MKQSFTADEAFSISLEKKNRVGTTDDKMFTITFSEKEKFDCYNWVAHQSIMGDLLIMIGKKNNIALYEKIKGNKSWKNCGQYTEINKL